jgi:hypothetical protein
MLCCDEQTWCGACDIAAAGDWDGMPEAVVTNPIESSSSNSSSAIKAPRAKRNAKERRYQPELKADTEPWRPKALPDAAPSQCAPGEQICDAAPTRDQAMANNI